MIGPRASGPPHRTFPSMPQAIEPHRSEREPIQRSPAAGTEIRPNYPRESPLRRKLHQCRASRQSRALVQYTVDARGLMYPSGNSGQQTRR